MVGSFVWSFRLPRCLTWAAEAVRGESDRQPRGGGFPPRSPKRRSRGCRGKGGGRGRVPAEDTARGVSGGSKGAPSWWRIHAAGHPGEVRQKGKGAARHGRRESGPMRKGPAIGPLPLIFLLPVGLADFVSRTLRQKVAGVNSLPEPIWALYRQPAKTAYSPDGNPHLSGPLRRPTRPCAAPACFGPARTPEGPKRTGRGEKKAAPRGRGQSDREEVIQTVRDHGPDGFTLAANG